MKLRIEIKFAAAFDPVIAIGEVVIIRVVFVRAGAGLVLMVEMQFVDDSDSFQKGMGGEDWPKGQEHSRKNLANRPHSRQHKRRIGSGATGMLSFDLKEKPGIASDPGRGKLRGVTIRFLLGPAGTGKTWRCIREARAELRAAVLGRELIFLAPKQATFQIERDILADPELQAYSRLQVLSFERLARFVLKRLGEPVPALLSEEGRTMVLRRLLTVHGSELRIFKNCAKRMNFPQELSAQIREFRQHLVRGEKFERLRQQVTGPLRDKLHDLDLIATRYEEWLREQKLEDADALLEIAAHALRKARGTVERLRIAALWMDGFAQMTPAEQQLLAALIPFCERATLAFCLETEADAPWPAPWRTVRETFLQVRARLAAMAPGAKMPVELLPRGPEGRFARSPGLAHLERFWSCRQGFAGREGGVSLHVCGSQEEEVRFCARTILREVRNGKRFSEMGVLLRSFTGHGELIERIFKRYEIPVFIDQRASVAHHPLAELIRGALRSIAFGWKQQDVIAMIKSGFFGLATDQVDMFENGILANGWEGEDWSKRFATRAEKARYDSARYELFREIVTEPIAGLGRQLGGNFDGRGLAMAVREFLAGLKVEPRLMGWASGPQGQVQATVWEQIDQWLQNVERGFAGVSMPLLDWMPVVEAGLASLTVGLIPPALDQVLVGSVDRSRNPDLKTVFVLGMNERIFPQPPRENHLLNEADRQQLLEMDLALGGLPIDQIEQEQFYGYIACTRARERLVITWARSDRAGKALNPSRFVQVLQQQFPDLEVEEVEFPATADHCEHRSELVRHLFCGPKRSLPVEFKEELRDLQHLAEPVKPGKLGGEIVERLFGREITVPVTSLEKLAQCPFMFFVNKGLLARERVEFELGFREEGSFKHEVLRLYHDRVRERFGKWSEPSGEQARELIGEICDELSARFGGGLLEHDDRNRFRALAYKKSLQDFIEILTGWMKQNQFEPRFVELEFNARKGNAWTIELEGGRKLLIEGRADRVDIGQIEGETYFVVYDYKTGPTQPNEVKIFNGAEQQLAGYLNALSQMAFPGEPGPARPGGFFYVPLRSPGTTLKRSELLRAERGGGFAHQGVFDFTIRAGLDPQRCGQHHYEINKNGNPSERPFRARTTADFQELLAHNRELVRKLGEAIFAGEIAALPLKLGSHLACERCDYHHVCRHDSQVDDHRKPEKP